MSVTQLERATRTARKEHWCELCRRTIRPGEQYERQTNIYDGRLYDFKTCAHCRELIAHAPASLQEDIDWADEGYSQDTILEWEPRSVAELRLKVGWKRQWRHADGSLYALPVVAA